MQHRFLKEKKKIETRQIKEKTQSEEERSEEEKQRTLSHSSGLCNTRIGLKRSTIKRELPSSKGTVALQPTLRYVKISKEIVKYLDQNISIRMKGERKGER